MPNSGHDRALSSVAVRTTPWPMPDGPILPCLERPPLAWRVRISARRGLRAVTRPLEGRIVYSFSSFSKPPQLGDSLAGGSNSGLPIPGVEKPGWTIQWTMGITSCSGLLILSVAPLAIRGQGREIVKVSVQ